MAYYIGTSGWSYEHWFGGRFYPEDLPKTKAFQYYQTRFNTVELNVTFYRLLPKTTFEGWYKKTTDQFVFAVKGSRFITANKKLANVGQEISNLFDRVKELRNKAGAVLWQLSPNFKVNKERLESFIGELPKNYRHAFEFRHDSWFTDPIYKVLKKNNMSLVFADSLRWPLVEEVTADFIYARFHGGKVLYGSEYSDEELEQWAKKFEQWRLKGMDVYAYFNNDFNAYAPKNALRLKSLLECRE